VSEWAAANHGRLDGGRLGAGNLGLPPPSKVSARAMEGLAETALIRKADQ
jgi:hypothetical protein